MENPVCEICFEDYDETKVVPKMLDCGHTICVSCIHNMEGNDPQCPRCREPITKDKDYVTNYLILSLGQEKKPVLVEEKDIKEEFSIIAERLKNYQCLLTQKVDPLQRVSQIMEEFNKLKESKRDEEIDVCSTLNSITSDLAGEEKTLKRNLKIVTQCLTLMEAQDESEASGFGTSASPMQKVAGMKLAYSSIFDRRSYLKKIQERLRDGDVYVAHTYEGKILYGKLGLETLSCSAWKVSVLEERKVPVGATIVELEDLKDAKADDYSICSFLEIRNEKDGKGGIIIIDMKHSYLASQFMKLCTGECGVSYKHSRLIKNNSEVTDMRCICLVKKPFQERPKGLTDSIVSQDISFDPDKTIVVFEPNGQFSLWNTYWRCIQKDVVGVIRDYPHILEGEFDDSYKIEDCGIYFWSENWV